MALSSSSEGISSMASNGASNAFSPVQSFLEHVTKLQQENNALHQQVIESQASIAAKDNEIKQLLNQLEKKDMELTTMSRGSNAQIKEELAVKTDLNKELFKQLTSKGAVINELTKQLTRKDKEYAATYARVCAREDDADKVFDENIKLRNNFDSLIKSVQAAASTGFASLHSVDLTEDTPRTNNKRAFEGDIQEEARVRRAAKAVERAEESARRAGHLYGKAMLKADRLKNLFRAQKNKERVAAEKRAQDLLVSLLSAEAELRSRRDTHKELLAGPTANFKAETAAEIVVGK